MQAKGANSWHFYAEVVQFCCIFNTFKIQIILGDRKYFTGKCPNPLPHPRRCHCVCGPTLARYNWPHSWSCAARCGNAKYHVITNATYNRDPVPAKFKHVMNIDTCTLLCCDYSTLWEALHVNMVEIGARCSDKNVKILGRYQWIGWYRCTKKRRWVI